MNENTKMEDLTPAEEKEVPEVKEDITVFGKVDRFIVNSRKAKAEKKAARAEAKEAKKAEKETSSDEKKKINWTLIGIVGAAAAGAIGTAVAMTNLHEDESYELDENSVTIEDAKPAQEGSISENATEET